EPSALFCEITCVIREPWKQLYKSTVSIGRSRVLRVSLRKTTRHIEAGRMPLLRRVSLCPAKRLQHSCSTRSSKRNISARLSASRNNLLNFAVFIAYVTVTILVAGANTFSATLDFTRYEQILTNMTE